MTMTTETESTHSLAVEPGTKKAAPSSSKHYRMVALDLDGTLLNSQNQLSEVTKACLRRLDQQGFTVAIATGRAISTVYATVQSLNLPHPIPVVCSNGAEGVMCSVTADNSVDGGFTVEKKPLFSTPVPMVVAQRTIDLAIEKGCASQYYIGEEIFASPKEPHEFEFCQAYIDLTGSKTQFVTDNFKAALAKGPPSKQLVYCKIEDQVGMIQAYEEELAKEPFLINEKRAHIVRGQPGWFLEVMHPDVCKGNGLQKMCEQLDIPLEQCLAFGDGDNDIEFLQLAGRGFAMKNAGDDVKGFADEVIQYTNDEDGVAKTLTTLEEQGCLFFTS